VFGSVVLDVAISIIFFYLLPSLICSTITEGIARIVAMRSNNLQEGIRNLLNDSEGNGLAKDLYKHPLIKGLYRTGWYDRWRRSMESSTKLRRLDTYRRRLSSYWARR
jgi:hypothetical protein